MTDYNFKNLVFEGGGVKGIAYCGALQILEKKKILQQIERFAGTSAGAITASFLAVGLTVKEIEELLWKTNFEKFKDEGFFIKNIFQVFRKYGWFKGDAFQKWFEDAISKKVDRKITFKELKLRGKELYIVGTNLDKSTSVIFSSETFPEMQVSKALRISMSIPLFFKSVRFDNNTFIDGGVYYNYPINLFDNEKYLFNQLNCSSAPYDKRKGAVYNKETLGLRVDSIEEISLNLGKIDAVEKRISSIKDYLISIIEGLTEMANRAHLHKNDWHRTIYIENPGVKTTDFNLASKQKSLLVKKGKLGASNYFKWFDSPSEKPLNK